MPRYFTRAGRDRRVGFYGFYVENDWYAPDPTPTPHLTVDEHVNTFTGLLDASGNEICRAPNPMGFIWSDE